MKRNLGVLAATGAAACFLAAGAALGGSWDERVFTAGSHVDFDSVADAGPAALPALVERGRELFKAKFTTVDGAGRPKATQAIIPTKRKSGVNPPFTRTSGPDFELLLRLPQRSGRGRRGRRRRQRVRLGRLRERPVRQHRPFVLERAAHHRADGRGARRAPGARDDRRFAGHPGRRGQTGLPFRQGRAGRSRQQGRALRLDRRASRRHRGPRLGRRRRPGPDRPPVQPQGRLYVAASVHDQRAQHPSRHGGVGALRRALDGDARLRRERRAGRDHSRRRVGARRLPGDAPAADRQGEPARRLAGGRGRGRQAVRRDRLPFVPRQDAALEIDGLHRPRPLRHGRHAALGRGQGADRHRPLDAAVREDLAEERQGRVADPPATAT